MTISRVLGLTGVLALGSTAGDAHAATRTICMQLVFKDVRVSAPAAGVVGSRRGISPTGDYSHAVGHRVEVWDKDADGSDDLIGVATLHTEGTNCFTFEWELAPYSQGEAHPDIYIKYINQVRHTTCSNCARVTAITDAGGAHPKTSWRDHTVFENCTGVCTFPNTLYISSTPTTTRAKVVMALDTSQHALQVWGTRLGEDIEMEAPTAGSSSLAINQHLYEIRDGSCTSGFSPAHELGHVLQMQEFDRNSLRNDCSLNGPGHAFDSIEFESCATTEGWANYSAVVAWYNPGNASVVPFARGVNVENPTPDGTCFQAAHREFTVTKAFWDLDDVANESSVSPGSLHDTSNYTTTNLSAQWARFANGTANRRNYESNGDGDAVNVRDYLANSNLSSDAATTMLSHNCLVHHVDD